MDAPRKKSSARPRLTIDIDRELENQVERTAKARSLSVREFVLNALHRALDPPIQFYPRPKRNEIAVLPAFLEKADKEVTMVGATLSSLTEAAIKEALMQRIRQGTPMEFVTIDPDPAQRDVGSTDALLAKHYTEIKLQDRLDETHRVLAELEEVARQQGTDFQIYGLSMMPLSGVTIRNGPYNNHFAAIYPVYLHSRRYSAHPFLVVTAHDSEGEAFCTELRDHAYSLMRGARYITYLDNK